MYDQRQSRHASPGLLEAGPSGRREGAHDMMTGNERVGEIVATKLVEVTRLRDPSLAEHLRRTAEIACAIGAEMGLTMDNLDRLYLAAQLHDVGKLGISEAILWKPAGLTRGEWKIVRTHPEEGHRLITDVVHRDVAAAVLYHHERTDGEGYPFGIDSRTLPIVARIVQVADAFDAMTSERPYQSAMPPPLAVAEILRCSGTQFDTDVARAVATLFEGRDSPVPPIERRHRPHPADRSVLSPVPSLVRLRDRPA